jgi:hypothetical protein
VKQLRGPFRYSLIVTAKHEDRIGSGDLVLHQVVIPDCLGQGEGLLVHVLLIFLPQKGTKTQK